MHDEKSIWRSHLMTALAAEYNPRQCEAMIKDYDTLTGTGKMNPETAFSIAHESWSGRNTLTAVASVKEFIQRNLEKLSREHKGISKQNRLADLIQRFNANLTTLAGLTVDGKSLDENEIQKIKINMPYAELKTFTATASTKNPKNRGCDKLVFEIRY